MELVTESLKSAIAESKVANIMPIVFQYAVLSSRTIYTMTLERNIFPLLKYLSIHEPMYCT